MPVIFKNLIALLGAQVASWGISLLMVIVLPRVLGDAQYGRLSFALSFVAIFAVVANMGSSQLIIKETAGDSARMGLYVFNTLIIKVPMIALTAAIAIATVHLLHYAEETRLLVAIACIAMALDVVNRTFVAGLQSQQRMGRTALWGTVEKYSNAAVILATLAARKPLPMVMLAAVSTALISVVANGKQVVRTVMANSRLDLTVCRAIVMGGLPFLFWSIFQLISSTIDVSLLSFLTDDVQVGWYAVADRLNSIPAFLPFLVTTAFFPSLAQHIGNASPEFVGLANRAARGVFLACAPMAAGIALIAPDLIVLFHYPSGFTHAVPIIRILALYIPLMGVGTVTGAAILATDRAKSWAIVGACGAVLNVLLNVAAIPLAAHAFSNGGIGAAVVAVLTEVFMIGGILYLRPAGVLDRMTIGYMGRCTLACLLMIAVVLASGVQALPLKVALGGLGYVAASVGLRTLSIRDMRRFALRMLGERRLRGAASAP